MKRIEFKMKGKLLILKAAILIFLIALQFSSQAQSKVLMRRPTSTSSPMWIIHIDTWVNPDPQKCIDLIPKDIRPYVVFNISLSVSDFVRKKYPMTIAESWLRVCAENRVWATIQPASGYPNNFSNTEIANYEYFYKKYPNFIGWNFCEQSWGFDKLDWFLERLKLFTSLIKLGNKYGGYLIVSSTQTMNSPVNNAVAMLKLDDNFAATCKAYKDNYIFLEKYTTSRGFYDVESVSLGKYLSGYCGNYGIRFDECGWSYLASRETKPFPEALGVMPIIEHALLTGQTVTDGPELTWKQTIYQASNQTSPDGYTSKSFNTFPQFSNVSIDVFRKILDKSVRIPSKEEVLARTKIAIVNDVNSGSDRDKYTTPQTLFTELYAMDGEWDANNTWLKKSGRYPSIPMVFKSGSYETGGFSTVVNKSAYTQRWATTQAKVNELNNLFPEEYKGDIYASRINHSWITYNPNIEADVITKGTIPFKYNTCDSMNLSYSPYTTGLINEYSNKLQIYLNNYRTDNTQLRPDIIKIYGSTLKPTYTLADRDNHTASTVTSDWVDGVFTLTIMHNGPLDLTINCSGTATGRLVNTVTATIVPPSIPSEYAGERQYEAENFEYKNITAGDRKVLSFYTAMGYLTFGTNASASIRMKVNALKTGAYQLRTRYSASAGDVSSIDLYVNGIKTSTPTFTKTLNDSAWQVNSQIVNLKAGTNTILFSANKAGSYDINFDNIVIAGSASTLYDFSNDIAKTSATNPPAEMIAIQSGSAGVVQHTDANGGSSNRFKAYSAGHLSETGIADLSLFPLAANYSVIWKEYVTSPDAKKGVLLRANGLSGSCPYATGMRQGYLFVTSNNSDNTVSLQSYVASTGGLSPKTLFKSSFVVPANTACWYRATALGNTLKFECSKDSVTWEGGETTAYSDLTYPSGDSQLVWGLGSSNFSWVIDNISYQASSLSATTLALSGFEAVQGAGPSAALSIGVAGQSLSENAIISAPANYELSLNAASGFANSLVLSKVADSIPLTAVYIRLKAGLSANNYNGNLSLSTAGNTALLIPLSGIVRAIKTYDFSSDVATANSSNPPASNITVGTDNGATAGVVSYTDATNKTSNWFKTYTGGVRNQTGAFNLNLFPSDATDYSVVWKQSIGSAGKDYKVGVLLRGSEPAGTASTGYVQGLKQGYVFIAYTAGAASTPKTEFRIYRSTSSTSLSQLVSTAVTSLVPVVGQNVWYKASVTGSSNPVLKIEYSTDSLTWVLGASTTDATSAFTSGSTQFVYGLGSPGWDFYVDNISHALLQSPGSLTTSETSLNNFSYLKGTGGSVSQSFNLSGSALSENVLITAPQNFEISLNSGTGYSSSLTLVKTGSSIAQTTIFVRLKSGLMANNYEGEISMVYATSGGSLNKAVALSGSVYQPELSYTIPSALNELGYVIGSESVERKFSVSGSAISQNVTINAPSNFEISLSSGTGYTSSLNLTPSSGVITLTNVYLRLKAGLSANSYNGDVLIASAGIENRSFPVLGKVSQQAIVSVSETSIGGFNYNYYSGTASPVKSFDVWGNPLAGDILVTAPANFEISLTANSGFTSSLTLVKTNGTVESTTIYTRLKSGLVENSYTGNISVSTNAANDKLIALSGAVSWARIYDFSHDVPTTTAASGANPAISMKIGSANSTTAGVVSYTDNAQNISNRFRAYSGGNRNGTGIVDLNLFPDNATDYSVIWKQANGSVTDYKVGCLLRGNGAAGTATTGYVQGILSGYVFIVYNVGSARSEFRIYRSTSATTLATLVNTTVSSHIPAIGQNVWYRASATGSSPVNLKLEYSTDSLTWSNGAVATDATVGAFTSGSTQLVWGLASSGFNFFMDNITYKSNVPPLPVSLASFTAKAEDQGIRLSWSTYSESKNAGFDVERSENGETFHKIGFVSGNGNSTTLRSYGFSDYSPGLGNNYYRLKQIDLDGGFSYSEIKVVANKVGNASLSIYPNPVADILYVKSIEDNGELQIFDASGRVLIKTEIRQFDTKQVNVSKLIPGVYIYKLNNLQGKFIKE